MNSFSEHKLSRVGVHWCYLVARNHLLEANYSFTVYSTLWQYVPVFKSSWEKEFLYTSELALSISSCLLCPCLVLLLLYVMCWYAPMMLRRKISLTVNSKQCLPLSPPPPPLTLKQLCQQKVQGLQESGHYNPENVLPEAWNIYTSMTDINLSVNGIKKLL